MTRRVALGLQGGGSHGAFTWGALDRLLEEVEAGRLEIAAISGASAGALNATVMACGLMEGGPGLARVRLGEFWRAVSERGALAGNALFYGEPGPFGFNIDWNPAAIALEALGLVVSPYTNPFYRDALGPLLRELLPPDRLARLAAPEAPRLFLTAVDVATNMRRNFTQPDVTIDALRASACLPSEFRAVQIGQDYFWDGGYLGNPALEPLLDHADDLLLVLVNALDVKDVPPRTARAILDRLNAITFNASVVLELNTILTVNKMLDDLRARGIEYDGKYRRVQLHAIRDDALAATLGVVSKNSTALPLLQSLHDAGYAAAAQYFEKPGGDLADEMSRDLVRPLLKGVPASL